MKIFKKGKYLLYVHRHWCCNYLLFKTLAVDLNFSVEVDAVYCLEIMNALRVTRQRS